MKDSIIERGYGLAQLLPIGRYRGAVSSEDANLLRSRSQLLEDNSVRVTTDAPRNKLRTHEIIPARDFRGPNTHVAEAGRQAGSTAANRAEYFFDKAA